MKYVGAMFLSILFSLTLFEYATAHVQLDSPKGGETFAVGDTITIKWTRIVQHNQENWDLYFSSDGGVTWESLELDLPTSQLEYEWIVPEVITEQGQIQILMDNAGTDYTDSSNNFSITETVVSVQDIEEIPKSFNLSNNYPNPFSDGTIIAAYIPGNFANNELVIYDIIGNVIKRFSLTPGHNFIEIKASDVKLGIYFYGLFINKQRVETKKMVHLK